MRRSQGSRDDFFPQNPNFFGNFKSCEMGRKRWEMCRNGCGSAFWCCFRAFCVSKSYQKPPFGNFPHALRRAEPPPAMEKQRKNENFQFFEKLRIGLKRWEIVRNRCGSAYRYHFRAFCVGKTYQEPLSREFGAIPSSVRLFV